MGKDAPSWHPRRVGIVRQEQRYFLIIIRSKISIVQLSNLSDGHARYRGLSNKTQVWVGPYQRLFESRWFQFVLVAPGFEELDQRKLEYVVPSCYDFHHNARRQLARQGWKRREANVFFTYVGTPGSRRDTVM